MSVELLRTIVELLDHHGIAHMLAGSFASNEYGQLRATQDIDLVIDPSRSALADLLDELDPDRFYVDAASALDEPERRGMFNVIDVRVGWKVDPRIKKARPFSDTEFARRLRTDAFGLDVWIATAEDVVLSKLEWAERGRPDRQLADAASVLRVAGAGLDDVYLSHWAAELGVTALLERARSLASGAI